MAEKSPKEASQREPRQQPGATAKHPERASLAARVCCQAFLIDTKMNHLVVLPKPGCVLRALVTAAGYRPALKWLQQADKLDAVAQTQIRDSTALSLEQLELHCLETFQSDAGVLWSTIFADEWMRSAAEMRALSTHVDTTCIAGKEALATVTRHFSAPAIAELAFRLFTHGPQPRPSPALWLERPIEAWLKLVAQQLSITADQVADRLEVELCVSNSTVRSWRAGAPTRVFHAREYSNPSSDSASKPGHRVTVIGILREFAKDEDNATTVDALTGWLAVSVAYQSIEDGFAELIISHYSTLSEQNWSIQAAVQNIANQGFHIHDKNATQKYMLMERTIQKGIANGSINVKLLRIYLQRMHSGQHRILPRERVFAELLEGRLALRIAILDSRDKNALRMIDDLIKQAWWRGGWQQLPLLEDALLFAIGIGRQPLAKHCLARLRLLAPEQYPWTILDEQTQRLLGIAFEKRFPGRKIKAYLPSPGGVFTVSKPYKLTAKDKNSPNKLSARLTGRARATPLMEAAASGTAVDVQALLAAGGIPDFHVPESGESAITWALRRASQNPEGRAIVLNLLNHGIAKTNLNREASTARETPLDLAIDLDDAKLVSLLIAKGAEVNPIDATAPRPLCRALMRLHLALHPSDPVPMNHWLAGDGISINEARLGAISRNGAVQTREDFVRTLAESPTRTAIAEAVQKHMRPDIAGCRAVIAALLDGGSNPNSRAYELGDIRVHWTPTLLAAVIGCVETFELLLENKADLDLTLRPPMPLKRLDALHLATLNKRTKLIELLKSR